MEGFGVKEAIERKDSLYSQDSPVAHEEQCIQPKEDAKREDAARLLWAVGDKMLKLDGL